MKPTASLAAIAVALMVTAACDTTSESRGRYESFAAGPSSLPAAGVSAGDIGIITMLPGDGATLGVRDCLPGWGYTGYCSDGLRMTFGVRHYFDVPRAMITARFYAGADECARAIIPGTYLMAGAAQSFTSSILVVTTEPHVPRCGLPVVTDRLLVHLWDRDRPEVELHRQEFPRRYRFERR